MGEHFYPAYLYYGVRNDSKRTKDHRKKSDIGKGMRIEKRNNFMADALKLRRSSATTAIALGLKDSLVPR